MAAFNCYEDARRAEAYARLEFPGTYYLAYRDLPAIMREHVKGPRAMDFGCGTGRSTRFLQRHGFDAVGVDIADDMIAQARALDAGGDYRLSDDGDFTQFGGKAYDLVLSVFTFDNIPTMERKVRLFRGLGGLLKSEGRIVNVVSSPEIYRHEWASFSTRDFPENQHAGTGDMVRCVITDIVDKRPVQDVVCTDESYQEVFRNAGLEVIGTYRPLGREDEPYQWVNETRIAPWVIYVLKSAPRAQFAAGR
jgi:SAM-dependent methyltransferase